jgi:predicted DCC family thiol-disulfide oxidoreductase YuxK
MPQSATLIFDGACGFCQGAVSWIRSRSRPGDFEFLPCQDPERARRYPAIPEEECMQAMHLVLPDGRILAGDRAIPEILERLAGWKWIAALLKLPGTGFLARRVYAWVARNRYTISCALRR